MAIDLYTPRTLQKVVKSAPVRRTFLRDTFFKRVKTFHTAEVDVDFVKGAREVSPFINELSGGKIIRKRGFKTKSYAPALISPKDITTADQLMSRLPGEDIYSGKTPAERATQLVREQFTRFKDMNARRIEWMIAAALFTGKIPIVGEGVNELIDFGFTQKTELPTDEKWNKPNAKIYNNIKEWHGIVQDEGFTNPDIMVVAPDVATAMLENEKFRKLCDTKDYDLMRIQPRMLPNGATYVTTIKELGVDVYSYREKILDDWTNENQPIQIPLVPNGHILLASTNADFDLYFGSYTYLNDNNQWVTVEAEEIAQTWVERSPDRRMLALHSRPLPAPHEINSWYVAKVL